MVAVRAIMATRGGSTMERKADHPEWRRGDLTGTTDPARLDLDAICDFIAPSYWAPKRSPDVIARALPQSLGFCVFAGARPVGLCPVVSDRATHGYVCD